MRISKIGLISKKIEKLDDKFPIQDLLFQTGQIEQFSSGIYAYGHIPFLVKKNLDKIISDTLSKYGCSELSLPLLQPESIWEESGRLEKYVSDDVMFRCLTEKGNYCLAPTAEEAIVSYAKSRLMSYKNLPVTYFQIGPKFRNEIRTRGYLLRGKSFDMMDAYSFGRNQEELDKEYERMKNAYMDIFTQIGLNVQPVGADSGSIGGNKSEEFMCISNIGEDNILFDNQTGKAFNSELLDREDAEQYLRETYGIQNTTMLESRKAVELGHIFQLGDKYAKSMNATFIGEDGKFNHFIMGCYGIGVSRTLAMIYENNLIKDKNGKIEGLCLPINLAPYSLSIIPKFDDREKLEQSIKVYELLEKMNVPVLFDDRPDLSIGAKIKDSKVVGTPYTVVLGRTLDDGYVSVENNKTGEKIDMTIEELVSFFIQLEQFRKNGTTLEDIVKKNENSLLEDYDFKYRK